MGLAFAQLPSGATFHNQTYVSSTTGETLGTQSYMGWYVKGSANSTYKQVIKDKVGTGQMLLPTADSAIRSVA